MTDRNELINDFILKLIGDGFKPDEVFQTLADTVLSACYIMLDVSDNLSAPMLAFSILEFNKNMAIKSELALDKVDELGNDAVDGE